MTHNTLANPFCTSPVILEPFQVSKGKNANENASWASRPGKSKKSSQSRKEILPGKFESNSFNTLG